MEDAHSTGTDEKPNHDQHNAPQKLFPNDSENAADDQDHRKDPQNGGHRQTPFMAPGRPLPTTDPNGSLAGVYPEMGQPNRAARLILYGQPGHSRRPEGGALCPWGRKQREDGASALPIPQERNSS